MSSDLHVTAAARLRASRERYTDNRRGLVQLLADAAQPVAIKDILTARPSLAQSSAYRNLVVLERAGVVQRVASADEFARFELAEDLTEHHHHVICSNCGKVRDFTTSPGLERTLKQVIGHAAKQTGFDLESHSLDLIGLCESCA